VQKDYSKRVQITVEGHLDQWWKTVFPGLELTEQQNGTTMIEGVVDDEAALHGLLRKIRDAGMGLIGIRRTANNTTSEEDLMSEVRTGQRVVVFGATGRSGGAVVARLLERGHTVTAFVRSPEKLAEFDGRLQIATGDVLDPEAVKRVVAGQDAVVSCLGAGLKGRIRSEGTRNIIDAMETQGVRRLVTQSSLGVGESRDNLNAYWKYVMFGMLLRKAYADHGVQERYVRESNLDWTVVRPGALKDGPARGDYLHGFPPTERQLSLEISLPDLADFVVGELEESRYVHQAPALSYGRAGR
jgi:putative NADH-flavin reductase